MHIRDHIFTDGKIVSYRVTSEGLLIDFCDYADRSVELFFSGDVNFENHDGVGYDFADWKLSKKNDRSRLELYDDEGTVVFAVDFDHATCRLREP